MTAPYPDYRWCDTAVGGAGHRNNLSDYFRWRAPQGAVDCYRTVYRYPEAMQQHFNAAHSIRGYKGPLYADHLPIDFDAGDLAVSLENARMAVQQLAVRYDLPLEQLACFFSGAKGFHVLIPSVCFAPQPRTDLHTVFEHMVGRFFDAVKYDGGIYDNVRLFRMTNTKHSKSGLYKIQLSVRDLLTLTLDDILALAKEPQPTARPEAAYCEALAAAYREACEAVTARPAHREAPEGEKGELSPDARPCIAAMLEGVADRRHDCSLRIACHFAGQGVPSGGILALLRDWNRRNKPPIEERRAEDEFPKTAAAGATYDFGCNDDLRQQFCAGRCPFRSKVADEDKPVEVMDTGDAYDRYLDYIRDLAKAKINLGIPELDAATRGLAPGEVMQVIARTGVGKTALLLNLLYTISKEQGVPSLFFSLEMPLAQVFERMVQITANVSGRSVEEFAKLQVKDPGAAAHSSFDRAMREFGSVYFVDRDFLKHEDLLPYIDAAAERAGQQVRLVCIDYMGRMRGQRGQNAYEAMSEIAQQLKHIAKERNLAVLSLHQTNRAGTDGSTPITLDMMRDSGVAEEAADFILGMWRPEMPQAHGKEFEPVEIAILKARRGAQARVEVLFRKPTLRIGEEAHVFEDDEMAKQRFKRERGYESA